MQTGRYLGTEYDLGLEPRINFCQLLGKARTRILNATLSVAKFQSFRLDALNY